MYIKNVLNAMKSDFGKYMISIIIGIGFASLFRKACGDDKCYIFKGPSIDKIHNNIYSHDNKCYKFNEKSISCNTASKQISFA
jgi:hypothetical protein